MALQRKPCKLLYFLAALIAASISLLVFASGGIGDSDYYWHITLGKEIIESNAIPAQDTFSWLGEELHLQETAHSWLGSIFLFLFSRVNSNVLYGLLVYVFITSFVYALFVEYAWGKQINGAFENCLFLCMVTVLLSWAGRPQNIGFLLFAAAFYLLNDGFENLNSDKCWFLPIISVLWANIHGGTLPMLFAFNGLFVLLCLVSDIDTFGLIHKKDHGTEKFHRMLALLVVNIIAGLANPYGYKLYYYFFFTNNSDTKKYISEWQPCKLADIVVFLCLAFLFIIFASHIKVKLTEFAPILCCLIMTSRYVRIRSYLLIVMTPLIFRFIATMLKRQEDVMWRKGERYMKGFYGSSKRWTVASAVCLLIAVGVYSPFFATDPDKTVDHMDTDFVEQVKALDLQRMYTSYNDGGVALYHGIPCFADSRADLYPAEVIDASIKFASCSGDSDTSMQDTIEKWNFDSILLEKAKNATAIEFMDLLPGWERAIENDYYVVFIPTK